MCNSLDELKRDAGNVGPGFRFGFPVIESVGTCSSPYSDPMVTAPIEYQVWSSVLGSSLTTVNASGGKVETKVFAGGTHIATQQGDGGGIVYSTADPVTGTVGQFSGSGSTALKFEESEPLGQKIELTDPGTSYPATYQAVLGGGRDPEWQCLAAQAKNSSFWDMPVHCQKSEALKSGFRFEIMTGFIESNPLRTAIGGGPPTLQKQVSNEERSLLKALAAARKPAPWDNETDIVPESPDIPGADASQGGVPSTPMHEGRHRGPPQEKISQNCITALKDFGVWEKANELLKAPPTIDIETASSMVFEGVVGDDPASLYGFASNGTFGEEFDKAAKARFSGTKGGFALSIRPVGSGIGQIYYRGSNTNFSGENIYLLLHEIVHLLIPPSISKGKRYDLDIILANELELKKIGKNETAQESVSRFFKRKCDPALRDLIK